MPSYLAAPVSSGVAVGSSIGHAIGNLFSGSGSSENSYDAAAAQQAAPPQQYGGSTLTAQQQQQWGPNCQLATQSFTKCMDEQGGNMSICGWYLEQLVGVVDSVLGARDLRLLTTEPQIQKQCQAAASRY